MQRLLTLLTLTILWPVLACGQAATTAAGPGAPKEVAATEVTSADITAADITTADVIPTSGFAGQLVEAALERTTHRVRYDGSYLRIDYPGGDVPDSIGVCTDVVIRSYRALGIDLQVLVHEDMRAHFEVYPDNWGLRRPDTNIDHRRVPNLQTFFSRHGEELAISDDPGDYQPGDLVTWMLPRNLPHIGIVADRRSADGERPLIVHNIGSGPKLEDGLFDYPITGHYRYSGP